MTNDPRIPMAPSQLPQQRIHEVVDLLSKPDQFDYHVGYGRKVPDSNYSHDEPADAEYLAQVEWAWDPNHTRLEAYYLDHGADHWVLWVRYWSDNDWAFKWIVVGYVADHGVSQEEAAVHLITEFWKDEAEESSLDHFHWINEAEYLSVAQMAAIGRAVWGAA
jgi:hypothetical protein